MNLTRRSLIGGLGGVAAVGLFGCTSTPATSSNGSVNVTIGLSYVPHVQFAPFYLAMERGYFTDAGVNVTLRQHGAQEEIFSALLSGTEQVLCASADEAMVAVGGGYDVKSFSTMYRTYPVCLLAPATLGTTKLQDMVGKKIGVPGLYGSSYYALLAGLAAAEMTAKDVEIVSIGYTSVSALLTKKVDAVVGYRNNEPLQLADEGMEVAVIDLVSQATPNLVGPGLMTTGSKVTTDALKAIAQAVQKAQTDIVANPQVGVDASVAHVPDLKDDAAKANALEVLTATALLWTNADGAVTWELDLAAFGRMSELLAADQITSKAVAVSDAVLELN